jgi:hypothetical protein
MPIQVDAGSSCGVEDTNNCANAPDMHLADQVGRGDHPGMDIEKAALSAIVQVSVQLVIQMHDLPGDAGTSPVLDASHRMLYRTLGQLSILVITRAEPGQLIHYPLEVSS